MMQTYHYTYRDEIPDDWPEELRFLDRSEIPDSIDMDDLEPWELWASIDHGLRTADETMVLECAHIGYLVMAPMLEIMARWAGYEIHALDAYSAACDEIDYSGEGWAEPTEDDPDGERVYWLHEDVVWHSMWGYVDGVAWETSADAGMTWIYTRQTF